MGNFPHNSLSCNHNISSRLEKYFLIVTSSEKKYNQLQLVTFFRREGKMLSFKAGGGGFKKYGIKIKSKRAF